MGGVYAEKAIIQPLTEYLWVGGDAYSDDRLTFMSKLFTALRASLSELRRYYESLSTDSPFLPDGFPFVRKYKTEGFFYIQL